jgi:hypothetical protein
MSRTTSSSNFQVIFNNALKAYEKCTKMLETCDSHSSILVVLQQQVQEFNQSQSGDERLTKWLDSTVKVLYTFSDILFSCLVLHRRALTGNGVG